MMISGKIVRSSGVSFVKMELPNTDAQDAINRYIANQGADKHEQCPVFNRAKDVIMYGIKHTGLLSLRQLNQLVHTLVSKYAEDIPDALNDTALSTDQKNNWTYQILYHGSHDLIQHHWHVFQGLFKEVNNLNNIFDIVSDSLLQTVPHDDVLSLILGTTDAAILIPFILNIRPNNTLSVRIIEKKTDIFYVQCDRRIHSDNAPTILKSRVGQFLLDANPDLFFKKMDTITDISHIVSFMVNPIGPHFIINKNYEWFKHRMVMLVHDPLFMDSLKHTPEVFRSILIDDFLFLIEARDDLDDDIRFITEWVSFHSDALISRLNTDHHFFLKALPMFNDSDLIINIINKDRSHDRSLSQKLLITCLTNRPSLIFSLNIHNINDGRIQSYLHQIMTLTHDIMARIRGSHSEAAWGTSLHVHTTPVLSDGDLLQHEDMRAIVTNAMSDNPLNFSGIDMKKDCFLKIMHAIINILLIRNRYPLQSILRDEDPLYHSLYVYEALRVQFLSIYTDKTMLASGVDRIMSSDYANAIRNDAYFWSFLKDVPHFFHYVQSYRLEDSGLMDMVSQMDALIKKIVSTDTFSVSDEAMCHHVREMMDVNHFPNLVKSILLMDAIATIPPTIQSLASINVRYCYLSFFFDILRQHRDNDNVIGVMLLSRIGVELVNKKPDVFNRALYLIQDEDRLVCILSSNHGCHFVKQCPDNVIALIKSIKNERVVANILARIGEHLTMPNLVECLHYIHTDQSRTSFLLSQSGLLLYNQDTAMFFDQLDHIQKYSDVIQIASEFLGNDATFVYKIIDIIAHTFKTKGGIRDVLNSEFGQNLIRTNFPEFIKIALRLKDDAMIVSVLHTHCNQILFEDVDALMTLVSTISSDQKVFDIINGILNDFLTSHDYKPIYSFLRYPIFMLFFDEANIGRAGPIDTEVKRDAISYIRTIRTLATKGYLEPFSVAVSFPIFQQLSDLTTCGPFMTINELYKRMVECSNVDVYSSIAAQMITLICLRSRPFYHDYIQAKPGISADNNMLDSHVYVTILGALLNHDNADPVAVMASDVAIECAIRDPIPVIQLIGARIHASHIAVILTQKMGDILLKNGYGRSFLLLMDLLDHRGLAGVFNHPNSHHIFSSHATLMTWLERHPSWLLYLHDHHVTDASTDETQVVLHCANTLRQVFGGALDSEGMGHPAINAEQLDQVSKTTISSFYLELWDYFMNDTDPQHVLTAIKSQLGLVLLTNHPVKFSHLMDTLSDQLKVNLISGPHGVDIANICPNQIYGLLTDGHYDILYGNVRTVLESTFPHKLRYFLSKIKNNNVLVELLKIPGITQFFSTKKLFDFINGMDENQKKSVLSNDAGRDIFHRSPCRFFGVLHSMKNGSYLGGLFNRMVGDDMAHYYLSNKEPLELLWRRNDGLINSSLFGRFGNYLAEHAIDTFCELANRIIKGRSVVDTGIPFGNKKIQIICVERFVNRVWPHMIHHDGGWGIICKLLNKHDLISTFLNENKALATQSTSRFISLLKSLELRSALDILSSVSQENAGMVSHQLMAIVDRLKKLRHCVTFLQYPFPDIWLKQVMPKLLVLFEKLSRPRDIKSVLVGCNGGHIIERYSQTCFLILEKIKGCDDILAILSHRQAIPLLLNDYKKFVCLFSNFVKVDDLSSIFLGPSGHMVLDQSQDNLTYLFESSPMSLFCMTEDQKKIPAVAQWLSSVHPLMNDILRQHYGLLADMNQYTILKKISHHRDDAVIVIQDDDAISGGPVVPDQGPILIQDDDDAVSSDGRENQGAILIQDTDDGLDGSATLYNIQSYVVDLDGSKWDIPLDRCMTHIIQTVIGVMLLRFGVFIDRLIPHDEGVSYDWMNRNADVFFWEAIRIAQETHKDADSIVMMILRSRMGHILLANHGHVYAEGWSHIRCQNQKIKLLKSAIGVRVLQKNPDIILRILEGVSVQNTMNLLNSDPMGNTMVSQYPMVALDIVNNMLNQSLSNTDRFGIRLFLSKIKHVEGYDKLYRKL